MSGLRSPFIHRYRCALFLLSLGMALIAVLAQTAHAQTCPQIILNGGAAKTVSGGMAQTRPLGTGSNTGSNTTSSTGATSTTNGAGIVHANTAPCNTPPSIMIAPIAGTVTAGSAFFVIEHCSPNYGIDMATNSVTLNGVRQDANDGRTMPLMSMNPDTMPNSGFCGAIPKSGMTAQEIGRIFFRPGADTLVAHVCDDIAHCTTKTNIYSYTPNFPVAVTPDDSIVRVFSAQADSAFFVVHRLDSDTTTGMYNLVRTCGGAAVVSCTGRDTVSLHGGESKTIAVAFTGGASISGGHITLTATLIANGAMTDAGRDSIVSSIPGIAITPDNVALNAAVNAHNTAFFNVTNTGPIPATFTFSGICGGADTACVASVASQLIAAGATVPLTVGYKSEALSSTGTVKLNGVHITIPSATDFGIYNTTAITPSVMASADASAGSTLERSLCLTVAAGHGAASECGELRLAHALPSTRTTNKSRTPTLLYTSGTAHPEVLVPLNVTLPAGMPVPDSVTATLTINSTVRASGKWTGLAWGYASTQRIVLGFDALTDSTNIYPWTAQASSWYGSSRYNSSCDEWRAGDRQSLTLRLRRGLVARRPGEALQPGGWQQDVDRRRRERAPLSGRARREQRVGAGTARRHRRAQLRRDELQPRPAARPQGRAQCDGAAYQDDQPAQGHDQFLLHGSAARLAPGAADRTGQTLPLHLRRADPEPDPECHGSCAADAERGSPRSRPRVVALPRSKNRTARSSPSATRPATPTASRRAPTGVARWAPSATTPPSFS